MADTGVQWKMVFGGNVYEFVLEMLQGSRCCRLNVSSFNGKIVQLQNITTKIVLDDQKIKYIAFPVFFLFSFFSPVMFSSASVALYTCKALYTFSNIRTTKLHQKSGFSKLVKNI